VINLSVAVVDTATCNLVVGGYIYLGETIQVYKSTQNHKPPPKINVIFRSSCL
jgi:hypothetical protein